MSQTTDAEPDHGEETHHHPSASDYVVIAVFLAVMTAFEIGLYFAGQADLPALATIPALLFLTVLKFALVAMWFMHLRFDKRIYTRLFVGGLLLAGTIYAVVIWITLAGTPPQAP